MAFNPIKGKRGWNQDNACLNRNQSALNEAPFTQF